ncbi:MAG TPA: hypothetical protein VN816_03945 [Acidimicrobiales bacterium]|nr:hypothetical protein [Acidimicrobiales bacterium]
MKRIGKFTAGSLVGVALIVGFGGVATAASSTTTTGATATTSPTTSTPAKSAPKKPDVPSATQIWETVNATHRIDCAHAARELKRISRADAAAAKRLTRWRRLSAAARVSTRKDAKSQIRHAEGRAGYFQRLQKDGAALVKRIDAKCGAKTAAG